MWGKVFPIELNKSSNSEALIFHKVWFLASYVTGQDKKPRGWWQHCTPFGLGSISSTVFVANWKQVLYSFPPLPCTLSPSPLHSVYSWRCSSMIRLTKKARTQGFFKVHISGRLANVSNLLSKIISLILGGKITTSMCFCFNSQDLFIYSVPFTMLSA